MNKHTPLLVVFTLGVLIFSSCTSKPQSTSLAGTTWKLASYGPVDAQIPAADGVDTQIDFSTDAKVSGTMGCNRFSGSYEQKETLLTFGPLMATKMACPDLPMTQESVAFGVMVGTVKYELSGSQLIIFNEDGTLKIVLEQ